MRTILIIEDDYSLLEGLQLYLEMEGFRTLTATNGSSGVELAIKHRPDIVLTNFQMPGLDGLDVLRALRSDPVLSNVPVLFFTANHQLSVRDRALQAGADAFLRKPFSTRELIDMINGLRHSQLQNH